MYTVDYFINKFEAINEKYWIAGSFDYQRGTKGTVKHCAMGHCNIRDFGQSTDESDALGDLFKDLELTGFGHFMTIKDRKGEVSNKVIEVNDGSTAEYRQETPKERILAALNDIKDMQEKKKIAEVDKMIEEMPEPVVPKELETI